METVGRVQEVVGFRVRVLELRAHIDFLPCIELELGLRAVPGRNSLKPNALSP